MKYLFITPLLLVTAAAYGQMTQVTAQVKDANNQLYVNCQWSVVFVNQNTTPGAGPSQPAALLVGQQGHCDSSGNLNVQLADNVLTIQPKPSQWNFSICSAPGYVPGGTYCRSNMLVTVTGQTLNLTSFFQPLMPLLPVTGGGGGPGGITGATPNGGLVQTGTTLGMLTTCVQGQVLEWNGTAWACTGPILTVNGTAPIPNVLNFNSAAPLPPAGNTNVVFQLNGTNVSGYVPSGGTGGIGGSGTAGFVAQWATPTSLTNGFITSSQSQITLGGSQSQPFLTAIGAPGVVSIVHDQTTNCAGADGAPETIGCKGWQITFDEQSATTAANSAVNAAFSVLTDGNNSNVPALTGIGIYSFAKTTGTINSQQAGLFLGISGTTGNQVNHNRGLIADAYNGGGAASQPVNEALVAQTGFSGASSTTATDYTFHCMAPAGTGTMTTHACVFVDAQATGVELQLGPHTFAALPTCTATYEGSLAAITDSTVTTGTIAGGGTNHVLAYCNGTNWLAK